MSSRREIILEPPPRPVSLGIRLPILLGGALNQFGWVFFGFGMIFFWVFAVDSEAVSMIRFAGPLASTAGVKTGFEATSASEGDQTIFALRYAYEVDGRAYQGESYTQDSSWGGADDLTIEYRAWHPRTSRVQGMRAARFGWGAIFVAIFPAIGLLMVSFGVKSGRRSIRALQRGVLAYGKLVSKETTGTEINDEPVYELTYEFEDDRGLIQRATAKSHRTERLEDEKEEPLLYDPSDPSLHVLLDSLPRSVSLAPDGRIHPKGFFAVLGPCVLPLLAIVSNGIALAAQLSS